MKPGVAVKGKNILEVVQSDLCAGCGTCVALCPRKAIGLRIDQRKGIYVPELDRAKCNDCGICFQVCPGQSVDFPQLNRDIFGGLPENKLLGNYLSCYVGHATDYEIRYSSASGGLVTALLVHALEEGLITGALVTRMNRDRPLVPEPFIARTREDIIAAARSKYCPVPANIALDAVLKEDGKYAVVGLPCHIHGLRKAEALSQRLRDRVVWHAGIFCGHAPTFLWTDFHLWRKGVKKDEVTKLDYRGSGWPSGLSVTSRDGSRKLIPHNDAWGWHCNFGYYPRCRLCCDQAAELADTSFADAWLPEFAGEKVGKSIVVNRNSCGEGFIRGAVSQGKLQLESVSGDKVAQSQAGFYGKKRVVATSFAFARLRRRKTPFYGVAFPRPSALTYARGAQLHFESWASSKRVLWRMLVIYVWLEKAGARAVKAIILFGRRFQKLFH